MADDLNKPSFYPRVGNIRPQPRSPLQQAEMRERPLDAAMGALKRVLDEGSRMLDANKATPFDVTRGLVSAIPFAGPQLAKQFEQSNISVPIGVSLDSRAPGIETFDMPTKELMDATKWSDLVGTSGASRAAESLGYGEAPSLFDVLDATAVGAGAYGAAKMAPKAARAAKQGATAIARPVGQAISDAMIHQTGPLASGPLSALAPRAAMTNVVKPKGGNWESGAVEKALKPMKRNEKAAANLEEMRRVYPPDVLETMSPETRAQVERALPHLEQEVALNNWIDRNLTNYVKKEMGTPEDPIRRLAEEGVYHFPAEELRNEANWTPERIEVARRKAGFPAEGMAKSPEAQGWEVKTDTAIEPTDVGTMRHLSHLFKKDITEPWMAKVPDETKVYMANDDLHASYLGFDHILDVLRQDVAAGRIRPEQLNKVSMEQAVRRTHEFDQEQARKMAEAQLKQQEGFPLHKEYPEGYKWIELAPKEVKSKADLGDLGLQAYFDYMKSGGDEAYALKAGQRADAEKYLADALAYEGNTMGHCVGGYCPDVLEGRSRIYSLRDKKGEPHVTVEVRPVSGTELGRRMADVSEDEAAAMLKNPPQRIVQIKGKQNRAPKEEYLPYVQDFVKGGQWSDVGDLQNTRLQRVREGEGLPAFAEWMKLKAHGNVPQISSGYYTPEELIKFGEESGLKEKHPSVYNKWRENLGLEPELPTLPPEQGMAAGGKPRYPTEQEREALRKLRESFLPAATDAERLKRLRDSMERSEQKKVSFSDNPDAMMMEIGDVHMSAAGSAADAVLAAKRAAEAAKARKAAQAAKVAEEAEKALPAVLPRAPAKTKEQIRPYAQKMSEMMEGKFVRPDPKKSINPAGKSMSQWKMEQELEHDISNKEGVNLTPQQVADIEKQLGMLKIGISGDTSISDKILNRAGQYQMAHPVEQEGGPLYGLKGHPWASNYQALKNLQTGVNELSAAHGDAPVLGQYMQMGPEGTNFAQHFADANLQAIDTSKMKPSQIESFNKLIREGNEKSGAHPEFPGIEDPYGAYFYFSFYPELRKHFNAMMTQPTYTSSHNLPDGRVILHAITEPELRDLPVTTTGFAQYPLQTGFSPEGLPLAEHGTYTHKLPKLEGAEATRMKYPMPAEIDFPDVYDYALNVRKYRPRDLTRVFQTATPRQIIDPQHVDEIKMYEELMKEYTGKKKGGQVKMAEGGDITAEDLEIEERPL